MRYLHSVLNINGDVLLFISEEGVGITVSRDVVLRQKAFQRLGDRGTKSNLVSADVINHQDRDVVNVSLDVLDVAHEIKQLQNIDILLLNAIAFVCCGLAAVNHATDCTLKEGVYSVIEKVERNKCILIFILHLLSRLLEAGQHGTLTTGKVFAGVAMLADLSENFLDDDKLIRYKREGSNELIPVREAFDVQYWIIEGVEVFRTACSLS